jgi:glycosyltransferase involved in cell wall biosynthesis
MVPNTTERRTLAFVVNHPLYRVGTRYYVPTPNILDLMVAFLQHAHSVVLCGPAGYADKVDPGWEPIPPDLGVFELPFYSDNLDLIRRAPILSPRLLRGIVPALRDWDIVGAVAPSAFGLMTVLLALLGRRRGFLYVRGNAMVSLSNIYRQSPWKRRLIVSSFWPLDVTARLCARLGVPTFTMGAALAQQYHGPHVYALAGYARPTVVSPPLPAPIHEADMLRRIVYVGRLSREKGVDILLHALGVVNGNGYDCRLTVVGDGPEAPALKALVDELGLRARVQFVGFIVDPGRLRERYLDAGVVVVPSRTEGVPVAMIEAMGLGRVVVATDVGGIPSVLKHEQNGLMVPVESPEALAHALRQLLDCPSLAFRLAQEASHTGQRLTVAAQARYMAELAWGTTA